MTAPDMNNGATVNNAAEPWSTVGIQAGGDVHDSNVYIVAPDAPPDQKYAVGVRFLEDGVPLRARELIGEAIAHRHDNGEVRFHWTLAMLSKRSVRDLTHSERDQLSHTRSILRHYLEDEWKRALQAIFGLLDCCTDAGDDDSGTAFKRLDDLPAQQRDKIIRHLDLVLTGTIKDKLWTETRQAANNDRLSNDRLGRVWAYFHPKPAQPRVRKPVTDSTTLGDRMRAIAWSSLFVLTVGYLGWLVLMHGTTVPIFAYLIAAAAGYIGTRNGLEWLYRTERLKAKERDYFGQRGVNQAPEGGFANQVDHSFNHYSYKYAPNGVDRAAWLADTAGIRNTLRDEIVELYRESRIGVDRVNWLIGYLIRDVRNRWKAGTLWEYREQYRTARSAKLWCSLSLAALIIAAVDVIVTAIQTTPLLASIAAFAALLSGRFAAISWLRIISERRRSAEELQESQRLFEERQKAYQRWKKRLDSTRPSETEMEIWLNCDKTILLDEALQHYRLAWRDIIAHAFLQTPARYRKKARVSGGPWRYSKYDIRLFLITQDGVREVSTELDFEHVSLNGQERNNFRFDAVSSVHVARTGQLSHTLELTLMNGPTRNIRVTDPEVRQSNPDENPENFSKINLDAAGFTHTLHILEGIAAEGKNWIDRDPLADDNSNDPAPTATDV